MESVLVTESPAWLCRQLSCDAGTFGRAWTDCERLLRQATTERIRELEIDMVALSESDAQACATRVWKCVAHHWQQWGEDRVVELKTILDRLREGELGTRKFSEDVLREVVLAQLLEARADRAAEVFESDYMPAVRATAFRMAGNRAADTVENLAAELILPRGERPPRIRGFSGKTVLSCWLRAVIANLLVSHSRRQKPTAELTEMAAHDDAAAGAETSGCGSLLAPLFARTVNSLAADDRLLVRWLVVDDVPQNQVARQLGIHSGNVTRRRQKVGEEVWRRVREEMEGSSQAQRLRECLDHVLAGDDVVQRRELGHVLSQAFLGTEGSTQEAIR